MTPYEARLWKEHDITPLPIEERVSNQYARGQCAELLLWADENYQLVSTSQENAQEEKSIDGFQTELFERHIQLLELYKHAADHDGAACRPNFTSDRLGMQIDAVCDKYSVRRLDAERLRSTRSEMKSIGTNLFVFDKMEVKPKGGSLKYFKAPIPDHLKAAKLIQLGSTKRDAMNKAHREAIKKEKLGT